MVLGDPNSPNRQDLAFFYFFLQLLADFAPKSHWHTNACLIRQLNVEFVTFISRLHFQPSRRGVLLEDHADHVDSCVLLQVLNHRELFEVEPSLFDRGVVVFALRNHGLQAEDDLEVVLN